MLRYARTPGTRPYRVEVSGWDEQARFSPRERPPSKSCRCYAPEEATCKVGTECANPSGMAHAYTKTVELAAPRTSLTPCVLDDDDDDHDQLEMLSAVVSDMGYEAITTSDPEEALSLVRSGRCRLVLADVKMPGMNGYEFLDRALRCDPGIHVIVMTGDYTLESALEAIRRGATDFLPKPIDRARLKRTLDEVATIYDQRRRVRALEEQLLKDLEFHSIVGKSPVMLEVFDFARKVARHYTNVLLVGQTGSGKELVARAIHNISPVSQQKLAVCNCSAMVDTLLESQLFGHVRGSFTGATDTRAGLFEYANNGTVFLDEIGETSLPMQAKLLRVIQNREIQRVASPEVLASERAADCRHQSRLARRSAGRAVPRGLVLPAQLHPDPCALPERAPRRYSLAGALLPEEVQRHVWKKHFGADAARPNRAAAAFLAGQCPRTGKRHRHRGHYRDRRFH